MSVTTAPVEVTSTSDAFHLVAESKASVQEYQASTAMSEDLVKAICRDGGVIVRGFASKTTLESLEKEIRPHLDADEGYEGDFFSKETRKANGLAGKSTTFCHDLLSNPLWQGVYDKMLTVTTGAWNGSDLKICTSKPQLSASAAIAIRPGGKAQPLHRDDMVHHVNNSAVTIEDYKIGRDTSVGLFVAGSKTTKLNGATRFQPRSHLQATSDPPKEEDTVYAELEAGDAFMMLASCYHGGSKNNSTNEERLIYVHFMIKGYLRQVSTETISRSSLFCNVN